MEVININNNDNLIEIDEVCPVCSSKKLYHGYTGDINLSRDVLTKRGRTEQVYSTVELEIYQCCSCSTVFVKEI
jgi:hypothetical protein